MLLLLFKQEQKLFRGIERHSEGDEVLLIPGDDTVTFVRFRSGCHETVLKVMGFLLERDLDI